MESQESLLENPEISSFNKFSKIAPKKSVVAKRSALNLLEDQLSSANSLKNFDNFGFNKKKYKIYFTLPEPIYEIIRIDLDLSGDETVENVMASILAKFNEKFKIDELNFQFDITKHSTFELILCSKTGKGKASMPSIERSQMLSMTGMTNFALIDKEESKKNVKRTKDLNSVETNETFWPTESIRTENDVNFHNLRNGSIICAKKNYSNSLIHLRPDESKDENNKTNCINYCKFSLCK